VEVRADVVAPEREVQLHRLARVGALGGLVGSSGLIGPLGGSRLLVHGLLGGGVATAATRQRECCAAGECNDSQRLLPAEHLRPSCASHTLCPHRTTVVPAGTLSPVTGKRFRPKYPSPGRCATFF